MNNTRDTKLSELLSEKAVIQEDMIEMKNMQEKATEVRQKQSPITEQDIKAVYKESVEVSPPADIEHNKDDQVTRSSLDNFISAAKEVRNGYAERLEEIDNEISELGFVAENDSGDTDSEDTDH